MSLELAPSSRRRNHEPPLSSRPPSPLSPQPPPQPYYYYDGDDDEYEPFLAFPYSLHTMNPRTRTPPLPGEPEGDRSRSPSLVIHVEQTVTVESVYEEPLTSSDSPARPFGDNSNFYQATVTAAAQLARTLFSAPSVDDEDEDADADAHNLPLTGPQTRKWIVTAVLLALANLMTYAVDSMMSVMVPSVAYDLDVQGFQWLLAGPAIGAAATVLTAGQLYAVLPFKVVYVLFVALLLLGIMSPGFAASMTFFFYTRVLVGVGLAGQQLGALIFLGHNGKFIDKVRRDFYISISTALGLIVGPIFGALFAHRHKIWAWDFYAAAMILALVQVVLIYLLPNKFDDVTENALAPWACTVVRDTFAWGRWTMVRVRVGFDILGCVLSFFGILTVLISLNLAGTWIAWSDPYLYVSVGMGGGLLLLLCVQQFFQIGASRSMLLFPTRYLCSFKTTALFIMTFLTSGIFQSVFAYAALYQLLTRPSPSAVATAFFMLFSFTGPYLLVLLIVPLYFGGGMIKTYPHAASLGLWSVVVSVFLVAGTLLLFCINGSNTPPAFAGPVSGSGSMSTSPSPQDQGQGLPTIAKQFALACVGFWSAVTLPLAHQILDVFQPVTVDQDRDRDGSQRPRSLRQRHPHHNRSFVLFATYLGAAVALTATGSVFMHLGPRAMLSLLNDFQSQQPPQQQAHGNGSVGGSAFGSGSGSGISRGAIATIAATPEDARILLLGYTFIFEGATPALFATSIQALRKTFSSAFAVVLVLAVLMFVLSLCYFLAKLYWDGWTFTTLNEPGVPFDWRRPPQPETGRGPRTHTRVEAGGRVVELEERGPDTHSDFDFGTDFGRTRSGTASGTRSRPGTGAGPGRSQSRTGISGSTAHAHARTPSTTVVEGHGTPTPTLGSTPVPVPVPGPVLP